jgi:hypothetical protein
MGHEAGCVLRLEPAAGTLDKAGGHVIQPASLSSGRPIKASVNKLTSANVCQISCVDARFVIFCVRAISRTSVRCSLSSTVYHRFRFGPLSLWARPTPVHQPLPWLINTFHPFYTRFHVPSLRRSQIPRHWPLQVRVGQACLRQAPGPTSRTILAAAVVQPAN